MYPEGLDLHQKKLIPHCQGIKVKHISNTLHNYTLNFAEDINVDIYFYIK